MKLFYSPAYVCAGYEFDTTRKAAYIAENLMKDPISKVDVVAPEPVSVEDLLEIHNFHYVHAVRTGAPKQLAQSQGFEWDSGLWDSALASTGGAVAAAMQALKDGVSGTLSSGLHHARLNSGSGFCTFNGLAVAALMAHRKTGGRVLILDLDAHCGGGTNEIVDGRLPWVQTLDVSVSAFDVYVPSGSNTLDMVHDDDEYLAVIAKRLRECGTDFDLCIYNSGMDPFEGCDIGGMMGITKGVLGGREEMVFDWCRTAGIPVAFTIAGGYSSSLLDMNGLVALHRMTVEAAAA